jgi:uncharacterized protein (DUF1800 family)
MADLPMDLIAHLYRRAGFGPGRQDLIQGRAAGYEATRDALLAGVTDPTVDQTTEDLIEPYTRDYNFSDINDIRSWWYLRMVNCPAPLREKMTLFWHGHFATANSKVDDAGLMYKQNQLFRRKGFGSFRDLLLAVAQDPAMLIWLDGRLNVKGKPNENFAREVMELFTMGIGNYTENDVRQGARAFTGWTLDGSSFHFDPTKHDNASKTFLGQTGNFNGTDIVDILAVQPATAHFLSRKLFTFFVHDHPTDDEINALAKVYLDNDTNIGALVSAIFHLPSFTSKDAYLANIKSPAEFIVGAIKVLPGQFSPVGMLPAFRLMGQDLFEPPNVKGWPGGLDWVSTITMLTRMNFGNSMISARPGSGFGNGLDLNSFSLNAGITNPGSYVDYLLEAMGSVPVTADSRQVMIAYMQASVGLNSLTRQQLDMKTRGLIHLIMSSAEYQMA